MGTYTKSLVLAAIFSIFLAFGSDLSLSSELIAPTRTLQHTGKPAGKLTILSEPPGLDVFLDGTIIGKTPVWSKKLDWGPHSLRVKSSETTVYVKPNKTVQITVFRGSFIDISKQEKNAVEPTRPEQKSQLTEAKKTREQTKEEAQGDLTPWERFINRSSPHF